MTYGERLREARRKKGIGLRKFEKLTGIDRSYASKVERGILRPFPEHQAIRVSRVLNDPGLLELAERERGAYWRSVRER